MGPARVARRPGLAGGVGGRRTRSLAAGPRLLARCVAFSSGLLSALLPGAAAAAPGRCGTWPAKEARVGSGSVPLPSIAARVPQVGAAGRCWRPGLLRAPGRGWRRGGGRGGRGLGAPGSQWSLSACAGTASCLACLSSGASFLDRRQDPPQRQQEQQRLSVNTLLCGGVSVVPGRVCACSCG